MKMKELLNEDTDHYTVMYMISSLSKYIKENIREADSDSVVFVNNPKKLQKYEKAYQDFLNSVEDKIASIAKEAVEVNKKLWQIKTAKGKN